MDNLEESITYYSIAAFHEDAPRITASMPAILIGKQGNHLISMNVWLDRAYTLEQQVSETKDEAIQAQYERSIAKAIYELQLHLLSEADDIDDLACAKSYTCLQQT